MIYNTNAISKMSNEVSTYNIILKSGTGVQEDPHKVVRIVQTIECSEIEAWAICTAKNFELYGTISKTTSWESPKYSYIKQN